MPPTFGVSVIPSARPGSDPVAEAVHAESVGFDLVSVWDHPHGSRPSFEAWTLLTWIAARTSRIRVASNVLGLPHRLPVLTAKMAESLQRLSGGRLILGLGAGTGNGEEFAGFGAPVRPPRASFDALEEALRIIRGVWTETPFSFHGEHYDVRDAEVEPKPEPPIPLWLGVYGPRGLALVGRFADGWLPSLAYAPQETLPERIGRIRRSAEDAGRDPDALTYALNVGVRVGGPPSEDPRNVAGEPDLVVERLRGLLDLGFDCLNLWVSGDRTEQRERLASEVIPKLR